MLGTDEWRLMWLPVFFTDEDNAQCDEATKMNKLVMYCYTTCVLSKKLPIVTPSNEASNYTSFHCKRNRLLALLTGYATRLWRMAEIHALSDADANNGNGIWYRCSVNVRYKQPARMSNVFLSNPLRPAMWANVKPGISSSWDISYA